MKTAIPTADAWRNTVAAKKQLSERQAWLKIAETWDVPDVAYGWAISSARCSGICRSAADLHENNEISRTTHDAMKLRMAENRPANCMTGFWWGRDASGAKKRAAFCRKMASLCVKPKPKNKPEKKKPAKNKAK